MNWQISQQPANSTPLKPYKTPAVPSTATIRYEVTAEASITWEDLPQFMDEVRYLAHTLLARHGHGESLHTTALVVTALRRQRLASQDWDDVTWKNRRYFFGAVYKAMGRALKDHARRRAAVKRAAERAVCLEDLRLADLRQTAEEAPELIELLIESLAQLEAEHPQWALIIQHHFYGGLTYAEIAQMMALSERHARRLAKRALGLLGMSMQAGIAAGEGTP